ncbi:hypothetical protein [Pelomonas cellulosilytica]|uniref:Lipoprotein n=1 Tax=Pelomonas cellulosilytica TaxID=2906762 RepID=A0ABS8XQU0_9BURK|nr:hypothetical protein [Pelomonas sp. P8]MCE4553216.1 hypothetical protein [Pelomonas sp. P8]
MTKPLAAALLFPVLLLCGCALSPVQPQSLNLIYKPDGTVKDSVYAVEQGRAIFCAVLAVDGHAVVNSIDESIRASAGMGNVLLVRRLEHTVAPGRHSLSIGCRSVTALPVVDVFNTFKAKGVVELSVVKGRSYLIKGRFQGDVTSAWIEDEGSGAAVTADVSGAL